MATRNEVVDSGENWKLPFAEARNRIRARWDGFGLAMSGRAQYGGHALGSSQDVDAFWRRRPERHFLMGRLTWIGACSTGCAFGFARGGGATLAARPLDVGRTTSAPRELCPVRDVAMEGMGCWCGFGAGGVRLRSERTSRSDVSERFSGNIVIEV